MFKLRNLFGVGVALVMMFALMATGVLAQPALQATSTPEATATDVITGTATLEATATSAATAAATVAITSTSVAPTVSPVSTPGTLPTTGDNDTGAGALSLIVVAIGAVLVLGALGLALSRRPE